VRVSGASEQSVRAASWILSASNVSPEIPRVDPEAPARRYGGSRVMGHW